MRSWDCHKNKLSGKFQKFIWFYLEIFLLILVSLQTESRVNSLVGYAKNCLSWKICSKSRSSRRGWGQLLFNFQSLVVHWIARISSLHCLSCRNPYQTLIHWMPPPSSLKPFFSLSSASSHPLPKNRLLSVCHYKPSIVMTELVVVRQTTDVMTILQVTVWALCRTKTTSKGVFASTRHCPMRRTTKKTFQAWIGHFLLEFSARKVHSVILFSR